MTLVSLKHDRLYPYVTPNKNYVMNPGFQVSQRNPGYATITATDNTYQTADRWRTLEGITSGSLPKIYNTDAFAPPVGGSKHVMAMYSTATGVGKFGIFQGIESLNMWDLRGQVVSLSCKLQAFGTFPNLRMAVLEWTGSVDVTTTDPIFAWNATGTLPTLNGSWAYVGTPPTFGNVGSTMLRYTAEAIGRVSTSANNLAVMIWTDSTPNVNNAWAVTDVKLEKGPYCTEFVLPPFTAELQACKRYYQKGVSYNLAPGFTGNSPYYIFPYVSASPNITTGQYYLKIQYEVDMWTSPTVVTYPYTTPANTSRSSDGTGADYPASSAVPSGTSRYFNVQNASGLNLAVHNNQLIFMGWTAQAEI